MGDARKRGDVLVDLYRLYVVLDVVETNRIPNTRLYNTLILAILSDMYQGEYAGQHREWGVGVETDEYLGKMELPTTL